MIVKWNITFLKVPYIKVLGDSGLRQEFLDLGVTIGHYAIQADTMFLQESKAPFQTFFLHVCTPTSLIALVKRTSKRGKGLC